MKVPALRLQAGKQLAVVLHVLDDQVLHFNASDFYTYASNRPHTYRNAGDAVLRFIRNVVI